jgi:hypothetical protein
MKVLANRCLAVEEAPEEVAAEAPVAPKGVSPDRTSQTPKTYNFGSGNIDARVSMAMDEAKYKEIYGEDGGILSFSLEGPGVDSSTGFKSVAGITYQGKMTPERLEEMMVNIAAKNAKPEKTQAEINKERQAAQREAIKAEKPSKEDVSEKKMLDAIESVKKDKGTANDFIAKHGKAMFKRANDEGDTYEEKQGILIATNEGWVCPCGKYKQQWAHKLMIEPQTR